MPLISIMVLLILLHLTNGSKETDCNLPPECSFKPISQALLKNTTFDYRIQCSIDDLNLNLSPVLASNQKSKCLLSNQLNNYFQLLFKDMVMLKHINLTNIIDYMNNFNVRYILFINKAENGYIESCQDFINLNITRPKSIFQLNIFADYTISFIRPKFKRQICPFVFNNSIIPALSFSLIVDTFFLQNIPRFFITNQPLNTIIYRLSLQQLENVHIDSTIINKDLFSQVQLLDLFGDVRSIDENVFVSMNHITKIKMTSIKRLSHKQGIKWIANMNRDLKVNVSNQTQLDLTISKRKVISLFLNNHSPEKKLSDSFPDEDFCLYKDFPFDQLIILMPTSMLEPREAFYIDSTSSCTYSWLIQYFNTFSDVRYWFFFEAELLNGLFRAMRASEGNKCDFNLLLSKCDKRQFQTSILPEPINLNRVRHNLYFIQLLCFFGSVLVSLIGLITNGIVVFVISHKKNKKELDEQRHFHFMRINAIINAFIFIIRLLNLMTECILPYDVYCSAIRRFIPVQLIRIVMEQFFGTALILMSHLSYIAFTLNRIALLGKEHGKIVNWMSTISLKRFLLPCFIISVLGSVVKIFKYQLNFDYPGYEYPVRFTLEITFIFNIVKSQVYLIADFLCDFIISFVYVVLQLIVDIGLKKRSNRR